MANESSKNKFSFYGQNARLKIENFNIKKKSEKLKKPTQYTDLIKVIDIIISPNRSNLKRILFLKEFLTLLN